jgi:hypothetical protein
MSSKRGLKRYIYIMQEDRNVKIPKPLMQKRTTLLALIAMMLVLLVVALAFFPKAPSSQQGYDYELSMAKLRRIGQALQIYRAHFGFLPPEQRQDFSDAGLPWLLKAALCEPGKPWTVEGRESAFELPLSRLDPSRGKGQFMQVYKSAGMRGEAETAYLYRERGERLPVLADIEMNDTGTWIRAALQDETVEAIVLRLDGSVERIRYYPGRLWDILKR